MERFTWRNPRGGPERCLLSGQPLRIGSDLLERATAPKDAAANTTVAAESTINDVVV
ncbi:MAG: hypothetical protein ACYDES_01625 [Acidimicrobiales bacterium]